jgi:hypothetical protein
MLLWSRPAPFSCSGRPLRGLTWRKAPLTLGISTRSCDHSAVRWLITLSARAADVERLLSEPVEGLSANPDDPSQLLLTLHDPEGDAGGEDVPNAAKTKIDAFVNHLNGVGRLRWGRVFEGVSIAAIKSFDETGHATQRVFIGTAVDHMLPEDFADMVERLGYDRPPMPKGLEIVNALDFAASISLTETHPEAMRAVHLVDLMLQGDDEIDWVAGYAALEVVEQDLRVRGVDGQALGWWTKQESRNFKATANSPDVLGYSARHGKYSGLAEAQMTTKDASWFVRRVVASWLTYLLTPGTNPALGGQGRARSSDP